MKVVELFDIVDKRKLETSNVPLFCKTNMGNYYVKFMDVLSFINGIPWHRALVNEYIGAEVAALMDLPIPETALVKCNKEFVVSINGENVTIGPSINFGSKGIEGGMVLSLYTVEQLKQIDNKNDLLSIMLFDVIMHNVDRDKNNGNTLVGTRDVSHLYIIDHGRLFGAGEVWNQYTLKNDQQGEITVDSFSNSGIYSLFRESVSLKEQINIARNKLNQVTKEKLVDIIFSTPQEWGLSSEDANALVEYLWNRFQKGEEYISLIINGGAK